MYGSHRQGLLTNKPAILDNDTVLGSLKFSLCAVRNRKNKGGERGLVRMRSEG